MPKNNMKDMRVMSGTKSQALPTSSPLYFKHSVLERDDHVAFGGCVRETNRLNKVSDFQIKLNQNSCLRISIFYSVRDP